MKRTLADFLPPADEKKKRKLLSITNNKSSPTKPSSSSSNNNSEISRKRTVSSSVESASSTTSSSSSGRSSLHSDSEISGLYMMENIVNVEMERKLLKFIDSQSWNDELSRRTQHYGVSYNYGARGVSSNNKEISPVPKEFTELLQQVKNSTSGDELKSNLFEGLDFKQVIVNEYKGSKQGISKHVDHCQDFGPLILIISLGDECVMKFHQLKTVKEEDLKKKKVKREETSPSIVYDRKIPRRSLIILSGDARYQFQHEIPKTMVFKIDDKPIIKRTDHYRRVSITFRSLTK